jgi:cell division protein FtsB
MTLQVWSILVNAVIAALILVGGIWLRSVVTQQLKSKDTAIQALDATIKSKEAEISALVNDRAPAIAKAYAQMREHANQMTEETQRLQDRFEVLSGKQQLKETLIPAREILAQVKGLQWAFRHSIF